MTQTMQYSQEKLTRQRWIILLSSCLINLCIGSMYAWSSLSAPMAAELNADLSSVFSMANALTFITMIIGGLLNDKYGPRWVMFVGGLLFGAGMYTCSLAQNVTHLLISYGLCVGWGMSLVYGCTISNTITFALVIALLGLVTLYICAATGSIVLLAIGLMLIGVCFGTYMGVFPGFCADQFGTKNNTVNYGILWIGFSAAGVIGPSVLSKVFQSTGSYQGAFVIASVMAALGLALTFLYRKLEK